MAEVSWFSFPTKICFGAGSLSELPGTVKKERWGKCLIVTDPGFAKTAAYQSVIQTLNKADIPYSVYAEVKGNPDEHDVDNGVRMFKDEKCQWVLGIGGGSPLDVAKAIRLLVTHPGTAFDYDDAKGGGDRIGPNVAPFIAIPTTAGTGSEVGRSSVIVNTKTKTKTIIFSPYLLANYVIADPVLTVDLPAKLTAATGLDALTHNVESYLAKNYHPIADGIALEGVALIARSLVKACKNPGDLTARSEMLMASMMGAIAFQKGLGVTHSLAHPLSTLAGMHHGLANGIMLVPAMKFNSDVSADRLADIANVVGRALKREMKPTAESAITYFAELCRETGIPAKLTDAGVDKGLLPELTEQAYLDTCWQNNPKPVTKADLEKLYREAF